MRGEHTEDFDIVDSSKIARASAPIGVMLESSTVHWNVCPVMSDCAGINGEMARLALRMHHAICRFSNWLRERWIDRTQRWWILRQDAEEGIAWTA